MAEWQLQLKRGSQLWKIPFSVRAFTSGGSTPNNYPVIEMFGCCA